MPVSAPQLVQKQIPTTVRLLYAVLTAVIVVPLLIFVWSAWNSYRVHFTDATDRLNNAVEIASEHVKHVLDTHQLIIEQIDQLLAELSDQQIRDEEQRLHVRLRFLALSHGQISAIYIFDAACRALVSSGPYPLPPSINCDDRDYARVHRERLVPPDASYIDIIRGRVSDQTVIVLSRRRGEEQSEDFKGITSVSIDPEYFPNFFSRIAAMGFTTIVLAREDGTFLARYPRLSEAVPKLPTNSAMMEAIRDAPHSGTFRSFSPVDNRWRQIAYRRIEGYPIYLTVGLDESAIIAAWRAEIFRDLVFRLPAVGALILLTIFALGRTRREAVAQSKLQEESTRRRTAEEQLRHSQKMEAIGQLTGGIAHDFNNLLMIVDGSLARLRKEPTGEKALRSLEMIKTAVERGAGLTRQLLSFSQRRTIQPRVIDLCELVQQSKGMIARALRGDVEIHFDLGKDVCLAFIDQGELELAILNLAVNARDAMTDGGSFTVSVQRVHLGGEPEAGGLQGEFVSIVLTDTGCGIEQDDLPRIFEPYFTTKQSVGGTGLGLSQVYGFAKQAGGHVAVASARGIGTTFTIYLPVASGVSAGEAVGHPSAPDLKPRNYSVLLVEDNAEVAEVLAGMLKELGHTVEWVASAIEAFDRLKSEPKPDRVISDILMPGGTGGVELAKAIRKSYPHLPVLLITGYSGKANEVLKEGIKVLKKPFSLSELAAGLGHETESDRGQVRVL
jgi:two-component system, NtrC family, sensor kinase